MAILDGIRVYARGLIGRAVGDDPVAAASSPATAVRPVDDTLEPATSPNPIVGRAVSAGVAPAGVRLTPVAVQQAQLDAVPIRPVRDNFRSDALFDDSFLRYQDAQLARLAATVSGVRHTQQLFHGSDLPPEVVFATGLPMKGDGDDFDLGEHQRELVRLDDPATKRSALRGGCVDARMPAKFAGEGGWVYVLTPRGGAFPLDEALGNAQARGAAGELEHSFGARQPACQIYAAYRVGRYSQAVDAHLLEGPRLNRGFRPVT